jgi:hypothetical protein
MGKYRLAALALTLSLLAPGLAEARFTFQLGDQIYADGQWFTAQEYAEYKQANPKTPPKQPVQQPTDQYPYQPQPQSQAQPYQPQGQAPPATTMVNGHPVVTIAPPPVGAPLPMAGGATVAAVPVDAAPPAMAPAIRSASCRTTKTFSEFPDESEKFDCGPAGKMTRQEMIAQGWHVDFVEKPSPTSYKLILSR